MNRGNDGGFRGGRIGLGGPRGPPRAGFRGGFRGRGNGFAGDRGGFGRGFGDFPPGGPRGGRGFQGGMPWRGGDMRGGGFRDRNFFNGPRRPFGGPRGVINDRYTYRRPPQQNRTEKLAKRLKEVDVGITEYISPHEGFNGVIKQRFSDFHVNEVELDGNIVALTDLQAPNLAVNNSEDCPKLEDVLPKETVDKLRTILTDFGKANVVEIDVTSITKDERKAIHEAIRGEFGDKLNSNTKTIGETKLLVICRSNKFAKQDVRLPWPTERAGKFLHFTLFKENMDTMEAVNYIASRFNMNPSNLSYAGTKDRRAVSCQRLAMFKVEPTRLIEKCGRQKRLMFGNFEFKAKPLQLGDLKGNRFRIVLRNVTGTEEQITQATESLQNNGFINYYGLQRFGNSSEVPTHQIGKELLLNNWKGVVTLILKPRAFEADSNPEVNHARHVWSGTGFANKAFNILKRTDYSIEGKLLSGLVKCGETNYKDALEKIPRNTRLLYLHAYQSLVWNKVVSRRIKEFGLKPIVGDLVLLEGDIQSEVFFDIPPVQDEDEAVKEGAEIKMEEGGETSAADDETQVEPSATAVKVEPSATDDKVEPSATDDKVEPSATDDKVASTEAEPAEEKTGGEDDVEGASSSPSEPQQLANESIAVEIVSKRPPTKVLTEEDLENYSITDIVLPLPGFDVSFPENVVKEWYEEYLKEDGLSIAGMKQNIRKYSLGGAYRKMIIKPVNFSSRVMRYTKPEKNLICSDLETLRGAAAPEDEADGTFRALILEFQLPSSAYATMALRDVLKQDTSTSYQSMLNTYHAEKFGSKKRKEAAGADENGAKKAKLEDDDEDRDIEESGIRLEDL